MADDSIGSRFFTRLRSIGKALATFDERYRWGKYVLAFLLIAVYTLFLGNSSVIEYWKMEQRSRHLKEQMQEIRPRFSADSARLEQIKGMGRQVEHIAREKHLMKSPGEEIYVIKYDTIVVQE